MDGIQELGQRPDARPIWVRAVRQVQELPSQGLPEIGYQYVDAGCQGAPAEIRTMLGSKMLSFAVAQGNGWMELRAMR